MNWPLLTGVVLLLAGMGWVGIAWEMNHRWLVQPICVLPASHEPEVIDRTAPNFELPAADGQGTFALSDYRGQKPVVLIFGSYTCPFIRRSAAELQRLYETYGESVQFCFIYTREPHALDGTPVSENESEGIRLTQPLDFQERRQRCLESCQKMGLSMPAAVDTMDDRVAKDYDSFPLIRMHLIDESGQVVYRSHGLLPYAFSPAELENSILALTGAG